MPRAKKTKTFNNLIFKAGLIKFKGYCEDHSYAFQFCINWIALMNLFFLWFKQNLLKTVLISARHELWPL